MNDFKKVIHWVNYWKSEFIVLGHTDKTRMNDGVRVMFQHCKSLQELVWYLYYGIHTSRNRKKIFIVNSYFTYFGKKIKIFQKFIFKKVTTNYVSFSPIQFNFEMTT